MIYRIVSNESDYLSLLYDDEEVITRIGEDHLIQADPSPIHYSEVWKRIRVTFVNSSKRGKQKPIPDIQHHFGHLFLSDKAARELKPIIADLGEMLEVEYEDSKRGFIFNPLRIVKADAKLSTRNRAGDVSSLFFDEAHAVFKTDFDYYYGVFCNQEFKDAVEKSGLTGVGFDCDLSNLFERTEGTNKPSTH